MLLETLLHERGPGGITNIFRRKNVTFFKLHGESFCCAAGHVHHKDSSLFDSGFLHTIADEAHDQEVADLRTAQMRDAEAEDALWEKHKIDAMKILMSLAIQALEDKGPEMMMKFLEEHIEIYPTEETMKNIVKRIDRGE